MPLWALCSGCWWASFSRVNAFVELNKTVIDKFCKPDWADGCGEQVVQESWRRLLMRLFVAAAVISYQTGSDGGAALDEIMVSDLRDVMIMATYSSAVARLMLEARVNDDLSSPTAGPPEHSRAEALTPGSPSRDSRGANTDRGKTAVGRQRFL